MKTKAEKKEKAKKKAKKLRKQQAKEAQAASMDPTASEPEETPETPEEPKKAKKAKKTKGKASKTKSAPAEESPVRVLAGQLACAGVTVKTWMDLIPQIKGLSEDSLAVLLDPGLGDLKTCAELLKDARKKARLTQKTLCEKSGIVQPQISEVERSRKLPSEKFLEAVAEALGVEAEDLKGFDFGSRPDQSTEKPETSNEESSDDDAEASDSDISEESEEDED